MRIGDLWGLVRDTVWAYIDDYAPSMGGALAFYTVFSIAPILVIVIAVAGLVFGEATARAELLGQVREMLGEDAAATVEGILREASRPGRGLVAMAFGLTAMMVGATTVFAELQSALNRIWQVPNPPSGGLWRTLLTRLVALVLVLGIAAVLLALVAASALITALGDVWSVYLGGWEIVVRVVDVLVSFALLTVIFALIYRYLPRANVAWRDVWLGAAVTAVLFVIGRYLIGLYLSTAGVGSSFGAAGSLVALLMWVYYSAQIFLLGAEFTWVYAHRYGSRAAPANAGAAAEARPVPLGVGKGLKLAGLVAVIGFIIGAAGRW